MTEKRYALLVASYQYADEGLRQLVAPAQDAEALAQILAAPEIGDFAVQTLLNESSYKIRQQIEAFFADRHRTDLLLLYFSGHGLKDEDGRLHFATADTKRQWLRSTAVSANFVNEVMRRSRSRRQVLLLDCCYSGAFARGLVVRADQAIGAGEYFKEGRGQVVLTASDAMQYAFEGDEIKGEGVRSVFTHTLVQGLATGEADLDGNGRITFEELSDYVHERVTDQLPQQKPRKWSFDVEGEIIIARNPHPVIKPAELPDELRQSIEDFRPWVREGAARQLGRLLQGSDKGLALAAHAALLQMAGDDSQQVRTVVTEILEAYAAAPVEEKAEPEPKLMVVEEKRTAPIEPVETPPPPPSLAASPSVPVPDKGTAPSLPRRDTGLTQLVRRAQEYFLSVERQEPQLVFWLLWTLTNVVGWIVGLAAGGVVGGALGWIVSVVVGWVVDDAVGSTVGGILGYVAGAGVFGAVFGRMQWLVLRRKVSQAHRWVLATAIGGLISLAIGLPLVVGAFGSVGVAARGGAVGVIQQPYDAAGFIVSNAVFGAVFGGVVGTTQWLILRRRVSQARWWVLASTVGWAAGWTLVGGVGWAVGDAVGVTVVALVGYALGFAVGGTITGIALIWVLQHPVSKTNEGNQRH